MLLLCAVAAARTCGGRWWFVQVLPAARCSHVPARQHQQCSPSSPPEAAAHSSQHPPSDRASNPVLRSTRGGARARGQEPAGAGRMAIEYRINQGRRERGKRELSADGRCAGAVDSGAELAMWQCYWSRSLEQVSRRAAAFRHLAPRGQALKAGGIPRTGRGGKSIRQKLEASSSPPPALPLLAFHRSLRSLSTPPPHTLA